ncbi:MAG: hypothetical protein ACK4NC_01070 [Candidatus Gracilibacteria bacterium]
MAVSQVTIEKLLSDLLAIREKVADNKAILRHYKVQSEQLAQLKNAYKELKRQIDDEKKRIEEEFFLDVDYEQAKKDELTYSTEVKEKIGELKAVLSQVERTEDLVSLEYNINNEPLKVQLERVMKFYVNGNEQR